MTDLVTLGSPETLQEPVKAFIRSIPTSGLDPADTIEQLESVDIDWWVTDAGDLLIRYWQVGAEGFVPQERVAEVRSGRLPPPNVDKLEWVSRELETLRASYPGQWVAITDSGVIGSASSLGELLAMIEGMTDEQPLVTQISDEPVTWNTAYGNDEVV